MRKRCIFVTLGKLILTKPRISTLISPSHLRKIEIERYTFIQKCIYMSPLTMDFNLNYIQVVAIKREGEG